jgi:TonB family protein
MRPLCLFSCLLALPVHAATAAEAPADQIDFMIGTLRTVAWNAQAECLFSRPDLLGRRCGDTWMNAHATAAHMKALQAARDDARSAANPAAAAQAQERASELLREQEDSYTRLSLYWQMNINVDYHRSLWLRALDSSVSPAERSTSLRIVGEQEERVRAALRVQDPLAAATDIRVLTRPDANIYLELRDTYQGQRLSLLQALAARTNPATVDLHARTTSCAAPASTPSGTSGVKMISMSRQLEDVYPPVEKAFGASGRVVILLGVSASGCAERLGVFQSSGVPALDDAALELAESASFLPAVNNSVAYASAVRLPFSFTINRD